MALPLDLDRIPLSPFGAGAFSDSIFGDSDTNAGGNSHNPGGLSDEDLGLGLGLARTAASSLFYFVAEKAIDFRKLVWELFRLYKTRIWMASLQGAGGFDQ
ncbi:hypothetical protein C8J57DRAFT_1510654 [Mycena rebaudengoi]|nr:hypothetical protein C8J57DRAFT_1510654 [Mycena rebaudengoi]